MDDSIKSDDNVKIEVKTKSEETTDKQQIRIDTGNMSEKKAKLESKLNNKNGKKKWLKVLLLVFLIVGVAGGIWFYMNKKANEQNKKDQEQIAALQKQKNDAEAEATKAKSDLEAAEKKEENNSTPTTNAPSQAIQDNIKAAVESKNTAALEGYMSPSVTVILAASECCGARTPTQAIADMKYLNNAASPWNFALPAATLTAYQTGDYKQYFPTDAFVGKAANNYVVSFSFTSGKISTVFMSISDVL